MLRSHHRGNKLIRQTSQVDDSSVIVHNAVSCVVKQIKQQICLAKTLLPQVWSTISAMLHARSSCGVVAFNGKLVVCGGYDGQQRSGTCESWDPETDSWAEVDSMQQQRSGASLVVAPTVPGPL